MIGTPARTLSDIEEVHEYSCQPIGHDVDDRSCHPSNYSCSCQHYQIIIVT